METNQPQTITFQELLQSPNICPRCGANWLLAVGQASNQQGFSAEIGKVQLRHCVNVCKTLDEATFNRLKEEVLHGVQQGGSQ